MNISNNSSSSSSIQIRDRLRTRVGGTYNNNIKNVFVSISCFIIISIQLLSIAHLVNAESAASDDVGEVAAHGIETSNLANFDQVFTQCKNALIAADTEPAADFTGTPPTDRKVDANEYVRFVQLMGEAAGYPDFLSDANEFQDLPLGLEVNFISLACLCSDCSETSGNGSSCDTTCCEGSNAHISNLGALDDEEITNELVLTCIYSNNAVNNAIRSYSPTVKPGQPTSSPTVSPTSSPTVSPTSSPTVEPTVSPTSSPTDAPSDDVSSTPTVVESSEPTIADTPAPTVVESSAPTVADTPAPTVLESSVPTVVESSAPTVTPDEDDPTAAPSVDEDPTPAPVDGEPTTSPIPGQPTTAPAPGEPTSAPQPGEPTVAPVDGEPTSAPAPGEPTSAPAPGEPTSAPAPGEPTSAPAPGEPTVAPQPGEPTTAPVDGEPTSAPAPGEPTAAPVDGEPTSAPAPGEPTSAPAPGEPTSAPAPGEPTASPVDGDNVVVRLNYYISVEGGSSANPPDQSIYKAELEAAMNALVPQVLGRRRFLRGNVVLLANQKHRKLPTFESSSDNSIITGFIDDCPEDVQNRVAAGNSCRDTSHSVILTLFEGEDANTVQAEYTNQLDAAIQAGDLQTELDSVSPNSVVSVLPTVPPPTPGFPTPSPTVGGGGGGSSTLSTGAIAGIAIGASILLIVGAAYVLSRRNREAQKDQTPFPTATAEDASAPLRPATDGDDGKARAASDEPDILVRAAAADYDSGSKKESKMDVVSFDALDEVPEVTDDVLASAARDDSSSNAGSSGWSSSAGVSTLESGDSVDISGGAVTSMAAIAAGSKGVKDKTAEEGTSDVPDMPSVTRADLDSAIEAGDWAAVGATAALLAAASDSQSASSRSQRTGKDSTSGTGSSVDAARAAELDHLVDAGDWEGVVLAAAKFDNEEAKSGSAATPEDSGTGSIGTSTYTEEEGAASGTTKNQEELRAEVEDLVRRVVPDEVDNVDEMMLQFKGREDELIETLRTMQERSIAQKNRAANQKNAKRDARAMVAASSAAKSSDGGVSAAAAAGVAGGIAAAVGVAAVAGSNKKDIESTSGEDTSDVEDPEEAAKRKRTALEIAIEAGDWEAVGEAAAMMSDNSVTTASSGEINALMSGGAQDASESDSDLDQRKATGVKSDRAAELDDMIDKGDWTGVVAAASRYTKSDGSSKGSPDKSTSSSEISQGLFGRARDKTTDDASSTAGERDTSREKTIKEEQDALQQAEIWMAVAQQSKKEGATEDAGASDAADWAIARSLSALRNAEERGELEKQEPDKKARTKDNNDEDEV